MEKRIPTSYIVTREQKRDIAKRKMKEQGQKQFCKHSYSKVAHNNFISYSRLPSYFAKHWREYA